MQTLNKVYKFKSRLLPDGHLSVPPEIAAVAGKEFEITMTPVDDVKSSVSLYLEGKLEKCGRITDINLDSEKIEAAVKAAFGTADIDAVIQAVRR